MARRLTFVLAAALVAVTSQPVLNQSAGEWPQWRGPNRDGKSPETGLLTEWPAGGPPLAWKAGGAGTGYSSMSVAAGRLYTVGARGGTEYIHAFEVATGKKLWEVANGKEYSNDRGNGPRGTPTIEGGRLYVLGASGDLTVLDAAKGTRVWTVNVLREFVNLVDQFRKRTAEVERLAAHHEDDPARHAEQISRQLKPAMDALRETGDAIESQVAAELWPLPTYRDLLFLK